MSELENMLRFNRNHYTDLQELQDEERRYDDKQRTDNISNAAPSKEKEGSIPRREHHK